MKNRLQWLYTSLAMLAFTLSSPILALADEGDPVDLSEELGAVNITGHINYVGVALAVIVSAVIGVFFVYNVLVNKGMKWGKKPG